LASRWSATGAAVADFLSAWAKDHEDAVGNWSKDNPDAEEPTPADLASLYFASYASGETKDWPETDGKDLQVAFFAVWWNAHPNAEVEPVPADMVMASGCGLDPHITLKAALYQLDRVAAAWADKTGRNVDDVRREIEEVLREHAEAPLRGLVGADLINVLEVNLAVQASYSS
jgi:K+-transporting ATPase ATPase C chain